MSSKNELTKKLAQRNRRKEGGPETRGVEPTQRKEMNRRKQKQEGAKSNKTKRRQGKTAEK